MSFPLRGISPDMRCFTSSNTGNCSHKGKPRFADHEDHNAPLGTYRPGKPRVYEVLLGTGEALAIGTMTFRCHGGWCRVSPSTEPGSPRKLGRAASFWKKGSRGASAGRLHTRAFPGVLAPKRGPPVWGRVCDGLHFTPFNSLLRPQSPGYRAVNELELEGGTPAAIRPPVLFSWNSNPGTRDEGWTLKAWIGGPDRPPALPNCMPIRLSGADLTGFAGSGSAKISLAYPAFSLP